MPIEAVPTKFAVYNTEALRLSASLHRHLTLLRAAPNVHALSLFEKDAARSINSSTHRVAISAYHAAADQVGYAPKTADILRLTKLVQEYASMSASQMAKSSKDSLQIQAGKLSIKKVASASRAKMAAEYQLREQYFLGTTYGWGLDATAKKQWFLHSSHDKDDICDDNEQQGPISIFDFFSSGAMFPPGHFGCLCSMLLILKKDNKGK